MRRPVVVGVLVLFALVAAQASPAGAVPGGQAWARRYNDPFSRRDFASSVKVSPNNVRLYVTGTSWGGPVARNDYLTIAYARTGYRLWARRFNGTGSGDDKATALVLSPDGSRIFVTGQTYAGPATGADYGTVAYNSAGRKVWMRAYDGPVHGSDGASAIAVSPDGTRVFVTGRSFGGVSSYDYATVAYDPATGSTLWEQRYDSGSDDRAVSVAVSPDATRVYATGTADGGYLTVAYDAATGNPVWAQRYGTDALTFATALAVSPDGTHVYVTGEADRGAGESTADTVAYSSDGSQLWVQEFLAYFGGVLATSPHGTRVYLGVAGGNSDCGSQICTVAYSSDGAQLWVRGYGRGNSPGPSQLLVTKDGRRIYLTYGTDWTNGNYGTLAYSSGGRRLWARQYNGPGNGQDVSTSLALSPDNLRLYATGGSWGGSATGYDYATVAYDTT